MDFFNDKAKSVGVLLTDLSKALVFLSDELLIGEQQSYGFDNIVDAYLFNCKEIRTKIGTSFSSLRYIIFQRGQFYDCNNSRYSCLIYFF